MIACLCRISKFVTPTHKAVTIVLLLTTMTSISVGGGEFYPGRSFSISQLLYAAKRKIQSTTSNGRCAGTASSTCQIFETQILQGHDDHELGRGEVKVPRY